MKQITRELEDYLYQFYRKIAQVSGKTTEQVMADTLFRAAGELSVKAMQQVNRSPGERL